MMDFFQNKRGGPADDMRGVKIPDSVPANKGFDISPIGSDAETSDKLNRCVAALLHLHAMPWLPSLGVSI